MYIDLWLRCVLHFFFLIKVDFINKKKKKCDADDRTCLLLKNVYFYLNNNLISNLNIFYK